MEESLTSDGEYFLNCAIKFSELLKQMVAIKEKGADA